MVNMVMYVLLMRFIYPPPPSVFITAVSVMTALPLVIYGVTEFRGKHMQYSKFSQKSTAKQIKFTSRTGMLITYTPAFLASLASNALHPHKCFRFLLLNSALTIHFFKRVFEVLFVHKYSGMMALDSVIPISLSYCIITATTIYMQRLTQGFSEPPVNLKYAGIVIFFVGISGNFYHHYLLSKLREKGDKEYKVPKGGLFDMVICPHYFFEILGFVGVSCISQTLYAFYFTLASAFYLMGRSYATRKLYLSKFEDFPKDVKAVIPYVF